MSQPNQKISLEEVVQFVEARESGKRSATGLQGTSINASYSTYRKNNQYNSRNSTKPPDQYKSKPPDNPPFQSQCGHCGKKDHSSNPKGVLVGDI